ncbi:MAG: hypothetical protein CVV42_05945 [Candidatus Riflebacteria bacterium HGW-Riflebacteria-2]|jgi:hypothetical protein|nr:MAG: hypothetical protein CVV42_05945 [Candidatus Riflebacteria bacterium HGW-Riflebacteria-2]
MSDEQFVATLTEFTGKPTANSAFRLITSCRDFICRQAMRWREPMLSLSDKMREIMSEMLLILLEDFDPARISHPNSVLAYLQTKIMRLTRPEHKRRLLFIENYDEIASGRCNFSPERWRLAEEIFVILRRTLLGWHDYETTRLEFLFIHVYPEIRWISRLAASHSGEDEKARIECDKKRHQSFNRCLRNELAELQNGDFSEIMSWSSGERSHLAWRLINIAPAEIGNEFENERRQLADWRENIDRRQSQTLSNLAVAEKLLESMKSTRKDLLQIAHVAEEAAPYGEEPDTLVQLLGLPAETRNVAEEAAEWNEPAVTMNDSVANELFDKVAGEVSNWLDNLILNKNAAEINNKNTYNSH